MINPALKGSPSFVFFQGVRYRTDGTAMKKDIGLTAFQWGITPPAALVVGVEGGAGNMDAGVYKIHLVFESFLGKLSDVNDKGPVSVTLASSSSSIDLTSIPVSGDPQVRFVNIYRTLVDEAFPYAFAGRVENKMVGGGLPILTLNGADSTLQETLDPADVNADEPAAFAGPFRYRRPDTKRFIEVFDDRIFAAAEVKIRSGLVNAVDGSDIMTGNGFVGLGAAQLGKRVVLDNEFVAYTIVKILTAERWQVSPVYVTPDFRDADPVNEGFTIIGDPSQLIYSDGNEPEYFPTINSIEVAQDEGAEITGLKQHLQELLAFTERSIWSVFRTSDPALPYGTRKSLSSVGTASPRSIVTVGSSLYFYSDSSFWIYRNSNSVPIGGPLGDIFDDFSAELTPFIIGAFMGEKVFFAVPVGTTDFLNKILVYKIRDGTWDTDWDEFQIVDMQVLVTQEAKQLLMVETPAGNEFALNVFDPFALNDGAGPGDHSGLATAATGLSLTDIGAAFPTNGLGLKGLRAHIRRGTGAGQTRRIISNTGTTITIDQPWTVIPDTTSEYTTGMIVTEMQSGEETFGNPHNEKTFMNFEIGLEVFTP